MDPHHQHHHHNLNLSHGSHHHTATSPRTTTPPPATLSYPPPPPPHHQNDENEDKKNGILVTPVASNAVYGGRHGGELQLAESLKISPIGSRPKLSKAVVSPSGIRYKECLKNHAASMGSNVVDGCGEFMPSGKEGTLEALKCAACQCHRNFHRREVEGESGSSQNFSRSLIVHPLHLQPPPPLHHHHHHQLVQPMSVAYGGGTATESSSEDLVQVFDEMPLRDVNHQQIVEHGGSGGFNVKKRFRTKFTPEQKEKMLAFAERLGWRLHRQDDEIVERFCNEVGVRRQVLKVWMHNNKNTVKKTSAEDNQDQQQITQHHAPPTPVLPAQTHSQVHLQPHHHHLLHLQHQQQQEHQALQGSS